MVEKSQDPAAEGENAASTASAPPTPPARRPGHRGMDPRETLAELTAKAHEISLHAGTKVGAAMKDVIGAAAGLTGFAVESARDLIQYMVRRGQMTQTEGDKLLREVEAAHPTKRAATRSLEDSARGGAQRAPSTSTVSSSKAPAAKPAQKPASKPEAAPVKAAKAEVAPAKATKAEPAPAKAPKAASKPETAGSKEDRASKSSKKASAQKAPAAPTAKKSAPAPAEKSAAKKVTKAAAKKSPAKGSASRAAGPPRPRAAAKSAPVKRKK